MSSEQREQFFRILFDGFSGYVCISRRTPGTKVFEEDFFLLPEQSALMASHCERFGMSHDLYYCPQLFSQTKRQKEYVSATPTVWADLDGCPPEKLLVAPTILIESSPNRWQGLWKVVPTIDPGVAEELSRRIAYYHADDGSDKSGWDLTQLLRVPFAYNHKYRGLGLTPQVLIRKTGKVVTREELEVYPEAKGFEYSKIPYPEKLPDKSAEDILDEHRAFLHPQAWTLFQTVPDEHKWSTALWALELYCFEAGLTREETYIVSSASACNKYDRDNRSTKLLWNDVCRAWSHVEEQSRAVPIPPQEMELPPLLTDAEREKARETKTIVEDYVEWAKTLGDAAWQYHEAGAFTILSALLSGRVKLPTSFGTVTPNLWFMILADTTLTRKTTAMDIAVELLIDIDPDVILATDGSIEGLMTSLSMRPGRPSIFLRDEFSGLLEALSKKDYYAGMTETFTKLYDGKFQKRILRKDTIEVRDPILIFFAGGIRTRVQELLNYDHVASGFLPRFAIITAESDVASLKPLGPPTERTLDTRYDVLERFKKIWEFYVTDDVTTIGGKSIVTPKLFHATLTEKAWTRYNLYEQSMLQTALKTRQMDIMTPTFDRLSKTGLKIAVLIAAARDLQSKVVVTEDDVIRAFYYVEKWRGHAYDVILNIGKSYQERTLELVLKSIRREPGVLRSQIMQNHHLNARDAEGIFSTLEQRNLISRTKSGRAEKLSPVEKGSQ